MFVLVIVRYRIVFLPLKVLNCVKIYLLPCHRVNRFYLFIVALDPLISYV